jgi:hypothetical protein
VASAIGVGSDIVSTDQHEAMGIEQTSVQLLGSSEFYHLPVPLKYSNQGRLGKFAPCLSGCHPSALYVDGDHDGDLRYSG